MNRTHLIASCALAVALLGAAAGTGLHASTRDVRNDYVIGRQTIYHLEYAEDGVARVTAAIGAGGSGTGQRFTTTLEGLLTVTPVARDARGTTLIWSLAQAQADFQSNDGLQDIYAASLRADAVRPFVTRVSDDGRIDAFAADASISDIGQNVMRRILATLETVAPRDRSAFAADWTTGENSPDGPRKSSYHVEPWLDAPVADPAVRFTRTSALEAPAELDNDGDDTAATVVRGQRFDSGRWRKDGRLGDLDAFETRTVFAGPNVVARSQAVARVRFLSTPELTPQQVAAARSFAESRIAAGGLLDARTTASDRQIRAARQLLGGATFASLQKRLQALRSLDDAGEPQLVAQLGAHFTLEPDSAASEEHAFNAASATSVRHTVLMLALESAATPEAQAVLTRAASAHADDRTYAQPIVVGLALLREPTLATVNVLRQLLTSRDADVRSSSELALGAYARRLQKHQPTISNLLVALLNRHLRADAGDDARITTLLALGNAGESSSGAQIEAFAQSKSPAIRSTVATALRRFHDSGSDRVLDGLLGDPYRVVRVAAASAYDDRPPGDGAYAHLRSLATGDEDSGVRESAIDAIWNAREAHSDVRDVVRHAADHDPSSQVRTAAARDLASDGAQSVRDITLPQTQLEGLLHPQGA